jgi:hypothetical protein
MSKAESLNTDRKTVRAALALVEVNPVLRVLVLTLIDRLYDELIDLHTKVAALEPKPVGSEGCECTMPDKCKQHAVCAKLCPPL